MMRRVLSALILAMATIVCASVASATTIQRYRLALHPNAYDDNAIDVRLELEYRSSITENKREGFKFVGSNEPRHLRAHTRDGRPLSVQALYERSSGQWKIVFALDRGVAISSEEEVSHAVIEFTQDLDDRSDWTSRWTELVWPAQFRVDVTNIEYTIAGDFLVTGEGCYEQGRVFVCRPARPTSITLYHREGPSLFSLLGGIAFGSAAMLAILFIVLRRRYGRLLEERGVLPPAPAPAYPQETSMDPRVFRAPPPLPTPQQLPPPVLPAHERQRWTRNLMITVAAAFGPFVATVLYVTMLGVPLSPAIALCLSMVIGAATALIVNRDGNPRVWPALLASTGLVGAFGAGALGFFIASFAPFVLFKIAQAIRDAPDNPSNQDSAASSSSSCSSSSCGGGGCGGGGCGGGGCGG
jgi:hypothetical protein